MILSEKERGDEHVDLTSAILLKQCKFPPHEQDCIDIVTKTLPPGKTNTVKRYTGRTCVVYHADTLAFCFPQSENTAHGKVTETSFLQAFASRSCLKVPQPKLHTLNNIAFTTYEWINGNVIDTKTVRGLDQETLKLCAIKLGQFLSSLHSFPITDAQKLGLPENNPCQYWVDWLEKLRKDIFPRIPHELQQRIVKCVERFIIFENKAKYKKCVCHRDIGNGNIVIDQNTLGIIDFGCVAIDNPARDFGKLQRLFGQDFMQEVIKNYSLPISDCMSENIELYEERHQLKQEIRDYLHDEMVV